MFVLSLIITGLVSYFFGSVNGAIIMSTLVFHKDIRQHGSNSAGLTNAYRVLGPKGAVGTLVIDAAKVVIPMLIAWNWVGPGASEIIGANGPRIARLFAGLFVMIGHAFPIYYGFKGGKGVLCCLITAIFISPSIAGLSLLVFLVIVVLTRYVSVGSMTSALGFVLFTHLIIKSSVATGLAIACAVLIFLMHIPNIIRLIRHKENKIGRKRRS